MLKNPNKGFTIVELLIVVVIITILAGLALVAFTGVQRSAGESALKADLNQAAKQLGTINVQNGTYPANTGSVKKSNDTTYQYTYDSVENWYCLTGSNQWTEFHITSDSSNPQPGVCDGHISINGPGSPTGNWTAISTGNGHTCGIMSGAAYCWGDNQSGQLGDGTNTARNVPTAVNASVMSGTVTAISTGNTHTCAIASGAAYCWGGGWGGQMGNGNAVDQNAPVAVNTTLMSGTVTSISNGGNHACAVAGGVAYCWGINWSGELGTGDGLDYNTPASVDMSSMPGTATAISAGAGHTCAIVSSTAYCWGDGSDSKLGNGSTNSQTTPVAVNTSIMTGAVSSISSGYAHTCAIAAGTAYCWGAGWNGQIGNDSSDNQSTPVAASTTTMSGSISVLSSGWYHNCAISLNTAYCWGYSGDGSGVGRLGEGTELSVINTPVAVTATTMSGSVSAISASYDHACAIAAGLPYCWGAGSYGELGNGSNTNHSTPVAVSPAP